MNEVIKAIKERRSVRKYKPDLLPEDVLSEIIDAGLYAASGKNHQAARIIVITDKQLRDELSDLNRRIGGWAEGFDPFYGAQTVLLVIAEKAWPTHVYDGSLVMGELMLAASSLGVGSCWIHRAKEELETEQGRKILERAGLAPDEWVGIGHCILGYAEDEIPQAAPRLENRVSYIR